MTVHHHYMQQWINTNAAIMGDRSFEEVGEFAKSASLLWPNAEEDRHLGFHVALFVTMPVLDLFSKATEYDPIRGFQFS